MNTKWKQRSENRGDEFIVEEKRGNRKDGRMEIVLRIRVDEYGMEEE